MITITEMVITPNVMESVFKVPEDSGMYFLFASRPTMATGPMIGINLANSMTIPADMFQKGVLSARPSNPLPLLAVEDVN